MKSQKRTAGKFMHGTRKSRDRIMVTDDGPHSGQVSQDTWQKQQINIDGVAVEVISVATGAIGSSARVAGSVMVETIPISQITTHEARYTDVRGNFSRVVSAQAGFTHVRNKQSGDFLAISLDAYNSKMQEGYQFVKITEKPMGDNLAMYRGLGESEKLNLPEPIYRMRAGEISASRRAAVRILAESRMDENAEHSS